MRPDVLPQTDDATLAAFDADFDESGDPVRMCMLKATIDKRANGDAVDGAGEHDVGFNISWNRRKDQIRYCTSVEGWGRTLCICLYHSEVDITVGLRRGKVFEVEVEV